MEPRKSFVSKAVLDSALGRNETPTGEEVPGTRRGIVSRELAQKVRSAYPLPLGYTRVGLDPSKYAPYTGGVDIRRQDLDFLRAFNQGTGEQVWRTLKTLPLNIVFSLIENVGQILDLGSIGSAVINEGDDFSNFLTQFANNGKDWLLDGNEVYRVDPTDVFDWDDPAWWLEHGSQLVESIVAFYAVGLGATAAFTKGASVLAKAINAKKRVSQVLKGASRLASAATLTYTEGSIEAADNFERIYQEGIDNGLTEQQATEEAARGAVHTVRFNMANVLVNLTALTPFFRTGSSLSVLRKSPFARLGGTEPTSAYLARLAKTEGIGSTLRRFGSKFLLEAPQEAIEEVVNEIASFEGYAKATGDDRPFHERLADVLGKEETRLAAMLGAFGGGGQTLISNIVPIPRKVRGDDGQLKTEWRSNLSRESRQERFLHQKTRQDLIGRLERFQQNQKDLAEAAEELKAAKTEPERATAQVKYTEAQYNLFSLAAEDMIKSGVEEQIIASYEEIAQLSEEDAESLGYDIDQESDSYYKTLAAQKINDVKKLTKLWADLEYTYGFDDEESLSGLPDLIFSLNVNNHNLNQATDTVIEGLRDSSIKAQDQLTNLDIDSTTADLLVRWAGLVHADYQGVNEIMEAEIEKNDTEGGRQEQRNLYGTDNLAKIKAIIEETVRRRDAEIERKVTRLDEDINNLDEASDYDVNTTLTELRGKYPHIFNPVEYHASMLAKWRGALDSNTQAISNITSGKGRRDYRKKFEAELARLRQQEEDAIKAAIKEASEDEIKEFEEKASDQKDELSPDLDTTVQQKKADAANERVKRPVVDEPIIREEPETRISDELEPDPELKEQVTKEPLSKEDRVRFLENFLNQTDYAEAFDLFDFLVENVALDTEFINTIQKHLEFLRTGENVAEEDLADKADEAKAPQIEPTHNTYSSPDDLSEELFNLQENEKGEAFIDSELLFLNRLIVPAATTVARRSRDFVEVVVGEREGEDIHLKLSSSNTLSERAAVLAESFKYIRPNTPIWITLDTEYEGPIYDEYGKLIENITYAEIIEKYKDNEKYPPEFVAPMKVSAIIDGREQTFGYIRTLMWIDQEEGGEPKNVANYKIEEDDLIDTGNWRLQQSLIRQIRQKIWKGQRVTTKVTARGPGTLFRNVELDKEGEPTGNFKYDTIENLITDPSIEFYVNQGGILYTGASRPVTKKLIQSEKAQETRRDGQVGIIIPISVDEKGDISYLALPIWIPTLNEAQVNTVWNLVEAFWENPEAAQQVTEATGVTFNRSLRKVSLSELLRPYVRSSSFNPSVFDNSDQSLNRIYTHIGTDSGHFQIARHGDAIIYTTDTRKRGEKNYRYMFERNLDGSYTYENDVRRLFSQGLLPAYTVGLNDTAPINDIHFHVDGPASSKMGYKTFLRKHLMTDVNGTNTIEHEDGTTEYIYSVHGPIVFDDNFRVKRPSPPDVTDPESQIPPRTPPDVPLVDVEDLSILITEETIGDYGQSLMFAINSLPIPEEGENLRIVADEFEALFIKNQVSETVKNWSLPSSKVTKARILATSLIQGASQLGFSNTDLRDAHLGFLEILDEFSLQELGTKPPPEDDDVGFENDTEGMLYSLPPRTSYEASSNLLDQYVKDERVSITCKTS